MERFKSTRLTINVGRDHEIACDCRRCAFGRDGAKAFKNALEKAKLVHGEYLPGNTTGFTAGALRLFDSLKDKPGRKIGFIIRVGGKGPANDWAMQRLEQKKINKHIFGKDKSARADAVHAFVDSVAQLSCSTQRSGKDKPPCNHRVNII